jgi:rubrerythrin
MTELPENFDKIVEQCILMEIQAMNLYMKLAGRVKDEETRSVLRDIAEMEESHVGRLVEIFSGAREGAEKSFFHVDVIKAFQPEALRMHNARLAGAGLSDTSPLDDYLTFAIVGESHARVHYERLSEEASGSLAKEIFRTLSREEADHEERLSKIQQSFREKS